MAVCLPHRTRPVCSARMRKKQKAVFASLVTKLTISFVHSSPYIDTTGAGYHHQNVADGKHGDDGLALNSLLSPRYRKAAQYGAANVSETDLDYDDEEGEGEEEEVVEGNEGDVNEHRVGEYFDDDDDNDIELIEGGSRMLSLHNQHQLQHQQQPHLHHLHHDHNQQTHQGNKFNKNDQQHGKASKGLKKSSKTRTTTGSDSTSKTSTPAAVDTFDSVSVDTRTEVAGSTLSLPMSSTSAATIQLKIPNTFEALLQDKQTTEFFRVSCIESHSFSYDCFILAFFVIIYFQKFLKSQVSDENLEFLIACDNFRQMSSASMLANEAKFIYEQFISQHSKQPVNLTWQIVSGIRRALIAADVRGVSPTEQAKANSSSGGGNQDQGAPSNNEISREMFDQAREHVFILLKKDCYPRFLNSDYHKEMMAEITAKLQQHLEPVDAMPESGGGGSKHMFRIGTRKSTRKKDQQQQQQQQQPKDSLTWNPAKLLSHIIGKAKKPAKSTTKDQVNSSECIRVTFPDGSVEKVVTDDLKVGYVTSLSDCIGPLCAQRGMSVFLCAIYQHGSEQPVDSQLSAASFNGRDLIIEQQVAFVTFHFSQLSPQENRRLLVRAKPSRRIVDVLQMPLRNQHPQQSTTEEVIGLWLIEREKQGTASPIQPISLVKLNHNNQFEGLVRDVQNHFVVAVSGVKNSGYDSTPILDLVQSHFENFPMPKFEDVLNGLTSSHSWHTFDEFGRINLSSAISTHWKQLRRALAIGSVDKIDESSSIGSEDLESLSRSTGGNGGVGVGSVVADEAGLLLNEPRSRKPIASTNSSITHSAPHPQQFRCRLVRAANPLGEIGGSGGRNTPSSSIENNSFSSVGDRFVGFTNMNYEMISSRTGESAKNWPNQVGYDENSCLMTGEETVALLGATNQASPFARRVPKQTRKQPSTLNGLKLKMPMVDNASGNFVETGGPPSPTTHSLVLATAEAMNNNNNNNYEYYAEEFSSITHTTENGLTESTL